MRIHYAGFVHPFFGKDRSDEKVGTPLIFEVRGHDVGVILKDSEKLARLTFYRMSQDCKLDGKSDYGEQTLQLSKFFGPWK
jgi:dCTP deaminase